MKKTVLFTLAIMLNVSASFAQVHWKNATGTGAYGTDENWEEGFMPSAFDQVIFDGSKTANNCIVTDSQVGAWFEIGVGGTPYGTLIVKNGGVLEGKGLHWTAVGWTTEATLMVEAGGTFTAKSHLWLGFNPGSVSHVKIAGTMNVNEMYGQNFENLGGKSDVTIYNGGILNLAQFHGAGNSIRGAGQVLTIMGGGKMVIAGDKTSILATHIAASQIVAPGGTVKVEYDVATDKTTVTSTASALGVKDFKSLSFDVYPNPTTDIINVKSETAISNLKVFNVLGQLMMEEKGKTSVNISSLSNGYYLVKAEDNEGKVGVIKIVKE